MPRHCGQALDFRSITHWNKLSTFWATWRRQQLCVPVTSMNNPRSREGKIQATAVGRSYGRAMIEPSGPLPQAVYWRRRAFAAGVSVLAVVLLAWIIGGLVEADDQNPVQGTAGASGLSIGVSSARPSSGRASAPPSSPGPNDPRGSVTTSPRTSGAATPSESGRPAPAATPPVATTTTTAAPPPGPPQPCPDAVMKVTATAAQPSYPIGVKPLLRLEITNVGPAPCTRDVSRKLREILVLAADGTRLWSSNDCYGPPEADVRVLAPNQPLPFSLNWAGRTSAPGCPVDREAVPAGTYQVVGKLGGLVGAPTPISLT
jgi:hypothetical protein